MKLLQLVPGLTDERGGVSAVVKSLSAELANRGHEVTVLTTDQGTRAGERKTTLESRVRRVTVPVIGPDRLALSPGFARACRLELERADVVHVHSLFTYPVHIALRLCSRRAKPVVLSPHGMLHPYSLKHRRLAKRLYLASLRPALSGLRPVWHYTSYAEAEESLCVGRAMRRIVVPNGLDPGELAMPRAVARARVSALLGRSEPYVLFLGRLHAKKRLDLLVQAHLAAELCDHILVVAGPDEQRLWAGIERRLLGAERDRGRVVRLGIVGGDERSALLAGASLFALPSEHENFGLAALEALACGTPALLSPHVDVAADAAAAGLCRVIPLKVGDWTAALAAALRDQTWLAVAAERGRPWVVHNLSWRVLAPRFEDAYRLARESASGGAASPGSNAV